MHFDITDVEDPGEIVTVAALILEILRDIPKVGEKVRWKGLVLEVMEMENARIRKILVKREPG